MTTPFGPQLIGETEKTLGALLRQVLADIDLTEPQWVTLRLADLLDGQVAGDGVAEAVRDRAHFADAADLVGDLERRGLLQDGRPTPTGHELLKATQARIQVLTGPIWRDLPQDDVDATERVLNQLVDRGRALLA